MSIRVILNLKLMLVIIASALWQPMSSNAQVTPNNWKPYSSEAGGFEVKYPNNWSVSTENKGNSLVVFFTSPMVRDDDVFQAAKIMICSTPLNETAWNDCTERDSHLSKLYKDRVRSQKKFVVSKLKVERIETEAKDGDMVFYYARFSSNGRSFFVRGNFTKSFKLDRYVPVFDKMLGSLGFLSTAKLNKPSQPTSQ
jgi:hypothetical protein